MPKRLPTTSDARRREKLCSAAVTFGRQRNAASASTKRSHDPRGIVPSSLWISRSFPHHAPRSDDDART
jgi:hypothetical protein